MDAERIAPILVFALLLGLSLFFVLRPIGGRGSRAEADRATRRRRLIERKAVLVQLLRDLEFDRKTGKLAPADFEVAQAEAETAALEVLAELDRLEQPWSAERVEEEIAAARTRLEAGGHGVRPNAS